jgi:hypothetical protein
MDRPVPARHPLRRRAARHLHAPNAALDADTIVLVDDAEILHRLDQRLAQDGYTRADLTDEFGMTLREAVRACGLPELAVNHEDTVPPQP